MGEQVFGGEMMNTKITITKNGNYSPNRVFNFGYKYENVGDTLEFLIPTEFSKDYHHYLVFKMKKKDAIILPVNKVDGTLRFYITSTITRNPGTYTFIFLSTEREVVNGDIDNAKRVFVSNEMTGVVTDNFLDDPINDENLSDKEYYDGYFGGETNLEVFYDAMRDLYLDLQDKVITGYYKGEFYLPYWKDDEAVTLSWKHYVWDAENEKWIVTTREDEGEGSLIPQDSMLRGFTGNYYQPQPEVGEDGAIHWKAYNHANKEIADPNTPTTTNIYTPIEKATHQYIEQVFDTKVDPKVEASVNKAVDEAIKFRWDDKTQILYITAVEYDEVESE